MVHIGSLTRGRFSALRIVMAALLAIAFVASYMSPTLAVGGQTGNVTGQVLNASGQPVAGAVVTMTSPSGTYKTTTDTNGNFSVIGAVVDTYTVSVTKPGFEPFTQPGITVSGDQTVALGHVNIVQSLQQIGHTRARSASAAFQPSSTQDTVTFSGTAITTALGKNFNTNQTALIASAPGVEIDKGGNLTVRGSLTTEIGLNFDGVPYTSVDHGGANSTFLNGVGSLTVAPGAGDATQGTAGAGVINLIPKRGTRPSFGTVDLEASGPYFNHQGGVEYGFATPDAKFSNYFSFIGNNFNQALGPFGISCSNTVTGGITSTYPNACLGYRQDQSFLNNAVYKFGKDQSRSLQLLYQTQWQRANYQAGIGPNLPYGAASPYAFAAYGLDPNVFAQLGQIGPIAPFQGTGAAYFNSAPIPTDDNLQSLIKLEYDQNLNANTFLAARFYHENQQDSLFDSTGLLDHFGGSRSNNLDGGLRTGLIAELTKQFDQHNLVTLNAQYELQTPYFAIADPLGGLLAMSGFSMTGYNNQVADFLLPPNTSAPLTPAGGANACPESGGCWLYYLNSTATFPDGTPNPDYHYFGALPPRIPPNLLNSPSVKPQYFGIGLRDQITFTSRLRADVGLRWEGQNYHLPPGADTGDIGPDAQTNTPRELEPRVSLTGLISPNDSLRVGYGKSAQFLTLGSMYTPLNYNYYYSVFPNDPNSLPGSHGSGAVYGFQTVPPSVQANPAAAVAGNGCGSGEAGLNGFPYRDCTSYGDVTRWNEDYFYPDNGNARTSTYDNWDATYSHQFNGGYALKVTPFYRKGHNIIFNGVVASVTDPVTGVVTPLSFRPFFTGFTQATGAEMYFTLPDRPFGWGGFLSATYTNAFSNRPAGAPGEDSQPTVPYAALAAGNAYRVGFLSPFVVDLGVQYKTRNGFRINPVFRYDNGFPYGTGNTTPITFNGVSMNVPSSNNASSLPIVPSASATAAVNYIDPTNPGSLLAPNFFATRGTPERSSPGGELSSQRLFTDLTLEYQAKPNRPTFGLQILNLFDNYYTEPAINTRYQPIATGVAGYQTGTTSAVFSSLYNGFGVTNWNSFRFGQSPYILYPLNQPLTLRAYIQLPL